MAISCTTPESEINLFIKEQVERTIKALIRNLQYIGERCLNKARETDSYKDRTGNLRSSLGYVIVRDGKIVGKSRFEIVKNGDLGKKSGLQYAKEVARQFPEGIALIVVAGMNYASYVADRGYDVITSAELLADKLTSRLII